MLYSSYTLRYFTALGISCINSSTYSSEAVLHWLPGYGDLQAPSAQFTLRALALISAGHPRVLRRPLVLESYVVLLAAHLQAHNRATAIFSRELCRPGLKIYRVFKET